MADTSRPYKVSKYTELEEPYGVYMSEEDSCC